MKLPSNFGNSKLTLAPWFLAFILFHVCDWLISSIRISVTGWHTGVYTANILLSLLLFAAVGYMIKALPLQMQKVSSIAVAFVQTWIIASHYFIYRALGETVNVSMLKFVLDNPNYYVGFVKTYLFNRNVLYFLLSWGALSFVWYPKEQKMSIDNKKRILYSGVSVLAIILHFVILNQIRIVIKGKRISADVALTYSIKNYSKYFFEEAEEGEKLHPSDHNYCIKSLRGKVKADTLEPEEWNVLLVVNESWGKNYVWLYDKADNCMPFFRSWVEKESDNFLVFKNAFTNSNATDVSMPSLFTGVPPWEPNQKLHSVPFVWNWANSVGLRSFFVSSQHFSWADLDDFFFSSPPEITVNADRTSLPQANDLGVDDIAMTQYVKNALDSIKPNERFFGIYHTNSLHGPFQQRSDYIDKQPDFPVKYENALYILDESYKRIYDLLRKKNALHNTIVIFTSDHGETEYATHKPGRVNSFYDDIISIPFLIYVPTQWREKHKTEYDILRTNQVRQVSNIDIVPTILDFLKISQEARDKARLSGNSLLTPIKENRYVFASNTNDVRHWGDEGFGIYGKKLHLVFSTQEPTGLYDVSNDRKERTNIWTTIAESEKRVLTKIIDSIPHFKRVSRRKEMLNLN